MIMSIVEIILLVCFASANASNKSFCSENKKSHSSSCKIFYNCINLPDGGYVWAPSMCNKGLIYQPVLQLCVLPGDGWTCDKSEITENEGFNTADNLISFIKTTDDDRKYFYFSKIDDANIQKIPIVFPYPLIEIDRIPIKHDKNNTEIRDSIPVHFLLNMKNEKKHINVKELLNKVFLYQHYGPLNQQTNISPVIDFSGLQNKNIQNSIVNFINNYFLIHKQTNESIKIVNENDTKIDDSDFNELNFSTFNSNILSNENISQTIDNIYQYNTILVVKGNTNKKKYLTIDEYKSLANKLKIGKFELIPCMKGNRLRNTSDCTKYYMCDPTTAVVQDYNCPSKTSFNDHTSVCDSQTYEICQMKLPQNPSILTIKKEPLIINKVCDTTGKFADITSDKYYFFCYSSEYSGKIEAIHLSCPNDLIFCENRRVCTKKRFCNSQ